MQELRESQKQTDVQQRKTDAQILELKKFQEEAIKEFRATQKALGDLGLVQGEVAEELFYRNVSGLFIPLKMRFDRVRRNVKVKGARGEYDIVADSNDRVLVVEVKNRLSRRMVDEFMEKKLPRFRELLPEYRNSRILAGIGALVVKDDVGRYAEKAGLYVLTQTSDGGAALMNRKGFTLRYSELEAAYDRTLASGWYILGNEVKSFELEFAAYCGVMPCIGVANGLDALTLILAAYKHLDILQEGDEVIVPANTYIATILAISHNRLEPVLVEPDIRTYNI